MLEVTVHQSGQTAAVERVLGIVSQSTAACYLKLYPSAIHSFIKPPRRLDPCTYIKAFQGFNLCCVCFGMFAHTQTTHTSIHSHYKQPNAAHIEETTRLDIIVFFIYSK